MAPEMPMAIYKFGAIAIPVCPTCSLCGRQCASATGRLQAVAACNTFASSSTMPQFSGPFKPRPALTTISASVKGTSPLALDTPVTFILGSSAVMEDVTTSAVPPVSATWYAFGFNAMILTGVFTAILAKALPENTFFLTTNPLDVSGNATAPDTRPAFNLTDKRGAMALPSTLLEKTITVAPVCSATCAITLV